MKKLISIVVFSAVLMGILRTFSYASDNGIPYSGGSGTADDPYLISCSDDIREIYDNIENDPSMYGKKPYFKLICDIFVDSPVSPLYEDDQFGLHCYLDTGYTAGRLTSILFPWSDDIFMDRFMHSEEIEECFESTFLENMGPLYSRVQYYNKALNCYISSEYFEHTTGDDLLNSCMDTFFPPSVNDNYDTNYYRAAAFTGVFDGNGHTISARDTYLFGFLKNGAVVKDLVIEGEGVSLAYNVDEASSVISCVINTKGAYSFECERIRSDYNYEEDLPFVSIYTNAEKHVIANNSGVVEQLLNYSDLDGSIVGRNKGNITSCINYGSITTSKISDKGMVSCLDLSGTVSGGEGVYTLEDIDAAGGDHTYFEGFDFRNVWIMKDGIPIFRSSIGTTDGDTNFDGSVNAKDSLNLKRHLSGADQEYAYVYIQGADMNGDGRINSMDSYIMKKKIAG